MGDKRYNPTRSICRGAWVVCRAISDLTSTLLVLLLFFTVCCLAYIATQETIPVPQFILRQLEEQLEDNGISIRMDGVRYYFDGAIIFTAPRVRSTTFKSQIASADYIKVQMSIPLLLFGKVKVSSIAMSNGTFHLPPVISPSGVAVDLIENLDFEVRKSPSGFAIDYAKLRFANATVFASGELSNTFVTPKGEKKPINITSTILKIGPQLWNQRATVQDLGAPSATVAFKVRGTGEQEIELLSVIGKSTIKKNEFANAVITARGTVGQKLALHLTLDSLKTPQGVSTRKIRIASQWDSFPTAENWKPNQAAAQVINLAKNGAVVPSIFAIAQRTDEHSVSINSDISLADRVWIIDTELDLAEKKGTADLSALIDPKAVELASKVIDQDLSSFAQLEAPAELQAHVSFPDFKSYQSVRAAFSTGRLSSLGAVFDRATGSVRIDGPQIHVDNILVNTGSQSGVIDIAFNQETLERRFLVEGKLDPNLLNGWFKSWWEDIWANFQFPEAGVYSLLDSRSIFKQPDSVRVTGFASAQNIGIRDQMMEDIWLNYFIRFYYLDFYNIELQRSDGTASGETQIAMDRDPRDEKEKMTALWVDAATNFDIKIGDKLITEVGPEIRSILEPYTYETPAKLRATAQSIRYRDLFDYEVDVTIDTDNPINVFNFPFESLKADVHIDNSIIDIKNGLGGIAGGILEADAQIVDENIEIEAQLKDSNFGGALQSAAIYFAATEDPEEVDAEAEPVDMDELAEYGGTLNLNFIGQGSIKDSLSYTGKGDFDIADANLANIQMFGILSKALEATPLRFSTLKLTKASGEFSANKKYLEFPSPVISGPVTVVETSGRYNMETDNLDFRAKLFPFRKSKMPVTFLLGVALDPFSRALEMKLTGELGDPEISIFSQSNDDSTSNDGSEID